MSTQWGLVEPQFRVLVVCTGNICRSPLAQRMLQAGFDQTAQGQFVVTSAGTHGLTGQSAQPKIAEIAAESGVSMGDFAARKLTSELIEEAHLILTMAREHRSLIVQMVPAAVKRTFTLREFARILPHVPAERAADPSQRWHSLVVLAQRYRRPSENPNGDDVVDPYGCSEAVYETMAAELLPAVETLIDWERPGL